jgi:F-type H+-transporting ATPase subunit alpha
VAGTLKLDQAQFRELEAFAKFGSDLDKTTQFTLDKGRRNVEILKQGLHEPMAVEKQVAIIFCGTQGLIRQVPVDKVKDFEVDFLTVMEEQHAETLNVLKSGKLTDEAKETLTRVAKEVASKFETV